MTVIVIRDAADTAKFDSASDTWTVTTADGRSRSARAVIDARRSTDATVAVHGLPNYFRIPGPDTERQIRYVDRCLELLGRSGCTRMEAKSRIVVGRWRPRRVADHFYLSATVPLDEDLYDGHAVLTIGDRDIAVRARLGGHVAAIDGHYHWRGTVSGDLPDDALKGQRAVTVSIEGHTTDARLVERTPWGGYSVTGVGAPPFASFG
ncbi:MAG TPA: DUF4873 domain-containing protein [Mycobacterium sp.]|nr:DUF4873 domain-containing protein [Mycobacterium sp.]HNM83915.1 DUF4873 domain-containing protein [Mycobacterium sp.]